jgi:hypothetical protein
LKRRPLEQLSSKTIDDEDEKFQMTRCLVCLFFTVWVKTVPFGQNLSFHLKEMDSFWLLGF